jgi:8-oxo-dGTP pyrophosphatase MutT (NUDIX family)
MCTRALSREHVHEGMRTDSMCTRRPMSDAVTGFRKLEEHPEFRGRLFSVSKVRLADPDGEEFVRDVVRHPGAVSIVPVWDDRTVTLVRQMRSAVGEPVLEAPAGTRDVAGEAPEETAHRELAEETGLEASRLERLTTIFNSPGYTDQRSVIFLATGLSRRATGSTGRTGVEERWMSSETVHLDDVERLVAEGRLCDATTLVGLFLARSRLAQRPGAASGAGVGE